MWGGSNFLKGIALTLNRTKFPDCRAHCPAAACRLVHCISIPMKLLRSLDTCDGYLNINLYRKHTAIILFDRVRLESAQPFTFDRERVTKSMHSFTYT